MSEEQLPRPLGDRVLVRQDPRADQVGLIHLPQGSEQYPPTGVVLAVGRNVGGEHGAEFRVGDRVLFKRRPGSALNPDGREPDLPAAWDDLVMLREDDVLGVVEGA